MRPRPRNRSDLDYLKGLADKRGKVLVEGLPGLGTPARVRVVGMRWNPAGQAGELTLAIRGDSELAVIMATARERSEQLEKMTIGSEDHAARVKLRGLAVTRIDDRGGSIVHVQLTSTSLGGRVGTIPEKSQEVPS
ncbi:MAG: hypothetical protein ACREK5_09380 [Gemmatimonadota bacterium]